MELKHIQSLEQLHLLFLNARLRKRKTLSIHPDEFERFESAIKAALPPFDFTAKPQEAPYRTQQEADGSYSVYQGGGFRKGGFRDSGAAEGWIICREREAREATGEVTEPNKQELPQEASYAERMGQARREAIDHCVDFFEKSGVHYDCLMTVMETVKPELEKLANYPRYSPYNINTPRTLQRIANAVHEKWREKKAK